MLNEMAGGFLAIAFLYDTPLQFVILNFSPSHATWSLPGVRRITIDLYHLIFQTLRHLCVDDGAPYVT